MKKIILAWLGSGLLCCGLTVSAAVDPAAAARFKEECRSTFAARLKTAENLEKLQYLVPWGASYDLDAFVDGYLATEDEEYLAMFTELAARAMAARADRLNKTDYAGRIRYGWLATPYYGVGSPLVLKDAAGNPSLELRTTLLAYNDETDITVTVDEKGGTFTIETANQKAGDRKLCGRHENLTMRNVESKLNTAVTRTDLKVKKLGDQPPAAVGPVRAKVENFVMHGHHTGKAVVPLLRFALLVKERPELREKYGDTAAAYLAFSAEAIDDMKDDWREHADGGYIVFERGMPFWSDAVAEPNNTLALSGLAYLYLAELTGNELYADRAKKLASFMRGELERNADGELMYYYWSRVNRLGWNESAGCTNTPVYVVKKPTVEDNSHLQHSLRFFVECCRYGVIFSEADLRALAEVFHARIDRKEFSDGKPLAERFDGEVIKGRNYQHFQAGWAEFYEVDPAIAQRIREIFAANPPPSQTSSFLMTNGVLLRAAAGTTK